MAFPTTLILDDFDRADEGPPPSANWNAGYLLEVFNNGGRPTVGGLVMGTWLPLMTGVAIDEVYATILVNPTGNSGQVMILIRVQQPTDPIYQAYFLSAWTWPVRKLTLSKTSAPTVSTLLPIDLDWQPGDSIGLSASNTATGVLLMVYHKPAAGAWTEVGSYLDPLVNAYPSGRIGLGVNTEDLTASVVDDFGGAASGLLPAIELTATVTGPDEITLAWETIDSGADHIAIERSLNDATHWTALNEVAPLTTTYEDADLTAGITYYYRVRAVSGTGEYSTYSNIASAGLAPLPVDDFMINAIADAIIDLLAADADLDAIKLFIRGGTPFSVPQDKTPLSEVLIGEETPLADLTGGVSECRYRGLITFTVQVTSTARADWLSPVDTDPRRAHIASYDLVKRLVMVAQTELKRYPSLNDLQTAITLADQTIREVVTLFSLDGPIVYGVDDRTDNYENFGSLPFVVETHRTVT